jgi:hypothetical protein
LGRTRTITDEIARLVENGVDPDAVFALPRSKQAAEMVGFAGIEALPFRSPPSHRSLARPQSERRVILSGWSRRQRERSSLPVSYPWALITWTRRGYLPERQRCWWSRCMVDFAP